jgi:hypothetical protein
MESLVNAMDRVHYIIILLFCSWAYTAENSWTALSIGQREGTPFAASIST